MESFFSKLTLYDVLAQLVPGWVFVCEVLYVLGIPFTSNYVIIGSIAFGYLLGLSLHGISEWLWNKCHWRNNPKAIRKAFPTYNLQKENSLYDKVQNADDEAVLDMYYEAYYYVCDVKQHGADIGAMERHIAFFRSMLIPVFCLIFVAAKYLCVQGLSICCCQPWYIYTIIGVLVIAILSLIWTIPLKQRKIYQCIWEDYEYLKRLENATRQTRVSQE